MIVIGIDPGTTTGLAVWHCEERKFLTVESLTIIAALERVLEWAKVAEVGLVIFEDARKRTGAFGRADAKMAKYGAGIREGIGSVKRDCSIWEEFLHLKGIPFCAKKPASGTTKWDQATFKRMTGWVGLTNEHSRDAGVLVLGYNSKMLQSALLLESAHGQAIGNGSANHRQRPRPAARRVDRAARSAKALPAPVRG